MTITILGVASSMRKNSYGTSALNFVLDMAKGYDDTETRLLNLREIKLPLFDPDGNEEYYSSVELRKASNYANWADAFVLVSPDYHGSMSGVIKNFLDSFWEEFAGKTFGYIVSSHEKGLTVMDQMRTAVRQCYAWSLPYGISINEREDLGSDGKIVNSRLQSRMEMLARDLVVYGRLIYWQFSKDQDSAEQNTFAHYYL